MFEKVNPAHPDKIADRIAGAIVDLAYNESANPKIAVEVLIGHGMCNIAAESSVHISATDILEAVSRIAGDVVVNYHEVAQDPILARNQANAVRCGDNGIFRGVPVTDEQRALAEIARDIFARYPSDGKYILDSDRLIICQSCADTEDLQDQFPGAEINPLGDRWLLGRHVLYCGDSTEKQDIAALMDGKQADLVVTDPPYNVAYEGSNGLTIQNDDMPEEQFLAFLIAAFSRMHEVMKPGTPFYIWHAETVGGAFRRATNEVLGKVRQMLVWNKNAFTMGHQDYQWKHEACIYGWTDGGSHYFVDDRTQATVIEDKRIDINKLKKEEMRDLLREIFSDKVSTTVIDENKPARNADHPTMKPLKLLARLIKNSSRQGDIVLDTFGGSGSTLIACEQLGRSCYTMELDPKYADVIVKRWLKFTGADHAELVRGGKKQPVTANML